MALYHYHTAAVRVVSGKVTDQINSGPVALAGVDDAAKDVFGRIVYSTRTASDGKFSLPIRGAAVLVSAPGYGPKLATLPINPLGEVENEEMFIHLRRLPAYRGGEVLRSIETNR